MSASWDFSGAGRKSSMSLQRLRGRVPLAHTQIAAPVSLGAPCASAGSLVQQQPQQQQQQHRVLALEIEDPNVPAELAAKPSRTATTSPQGLKPSVAFISKSSGSGDRGKIQTGRLFASQGAPSETPEAGRYRPGLDLVTRRTSTVDFRERPKHTRRTPSPGNSNGRRNRLGGELSQTSEDGLKQDSSLSSKAHRSASISRPAKADQMKVQLGRPDMVDFINRSARASPVRMTELTEVSKDKDEQYKRLSTAPVKNQLTFERASGRKSLVDENFFQPGKYVVQQASPSGAVTFGSSPRWADEDPAAAVAKKQEKKEGVRRDLSLARDCEVIRPRVKNVHDFSKSPPRFRSFSRSEDGDDELTQASIEWEMSVDLDKAHKAVERTPTAGPPKGFRASLTREAGSRGHRTFQSDLTMLAMHGHIGSERSMELQSTNEDWYGPRRDLHVVPFRLLKGRPGEGKPLNSSSLRQPRWRLPPDFARVAPQTGFASRAGIGGSRVLPCTRSYRAVAGWDVIALEGEGREDACAETLSATVKMDDTASKDDRPEAMRSGSAEKKDALAASAPAGLADRQMSAPALPCPRPGTSPCI